MAKRPQNGAESCESFHDFRPDFDATCCPANEFPTATAAAMFATVRKEQLECDLQQKSRASSTASHGTIPRKSLIREQIRRKREKIKGRRRLRGAKFRVLERLPGHRRMTESLRTAQISSQTP